MNKIFTLLLIICFSQISFAQTVSLDSLTNYVGKTVSVCSKVQSAYVGKGEKKTTYLSFGAAYPNATFTGVIFEANLSKFKYTPSVYLKDKNICITGVVSIYKEKPQIIILSEEQIKVE